MAAEVVAQDGQLDPRVLLESFLAVKKGDFTVRLPKMSGIEATRHIKKTSPKIRVVMITSHEDPAYQKDSLEAGASAFVHKREMTTALIPIMKKLLAPTLPATPPLNEK